MGGGVLSSAKQEMRSVFFFGKHQKELAIRALPSYSLRVSNTTTTTAAQTAIIVRDKNGKRVNAYYPNNIGRTFTELYMLAKQEANKIGGYITM